MRDMRRPRGSPSVRTSSVTVIVESALGMRTAHQRSRSHPAMPSTRRQAKTSEVSGMTSTGWSRKNASPEPNQVDGDDMALEIADFLGFHDLGPQFVAQRFADAGA